MKKGLLFLFAAITMLAISAAAQSATPRFGIKPNQDNTFRAMAFHYLAIRDTTGFDSVALSPRQYENVYSIHLLDSLDLATPVITSSYQADHMTLIVTGASGTKLQFKGLNWISAGTATLSSKGAAIIELYFNGANWVEAGRNVQ